MAVWEKSFRNNCQKHDNGKFINAGACFVGTAINLYLTSAKRSYLTLAIPSHVKRPKSQLRVITSPSTNIRTRSITSTIALYFPRNAPTSNNPPSNHRSHPITPILTSFRAHQQRPPIRPSREKGRDQERRRHLRFHSQERRRQGRKLVH